MHSFPKIYIVLVMATLAAQATAQEPPPKAAQTEAERIREAEALNKKYGAQLKPNSWFPVTDLDLGTHYRAQTVTGTFEFANPTEQRIVWSNLMGSCTCAKAVFQIGERTYELTSKPRPNQLFLVTEEGGVERRQRVDRIEIGPREQGRVIAHLELLATPGPRQAYLTANTTDAALPGFRIRWRGWSKRVFELTPSQVLLENVQWNETREFTIDVTSPVAPDFAITGMTSSSQAFAAEWHKVVRDGRPAWTIAGKFGPATADLASTVLTFQTDVAQHPSFQVRVAARVENPIKVAPRGFLSFGMVRRGREFTRAVTLTANDGKPLAAAKLTFDGLTVDAQYVQARTRREGLALVVEIVVSPKAPRGLLKGTLIVGLDHDLVKQKRIEFNGFVR